MSLPANWSTVTVTGTYLNVDGDPLKGTVAFSTAVRVVDAAANVTVPPGVRQVSLDKDGTFSVVLPATDDPDVAPTGFTYRVDENLLLPSGVRALATYLILLPAATPTVDLADVVPVTAVAEVSPYLRAADLGTVVETPAGAQAKANAARSAAESTAATALGSLSTEVDGRLDPLEAARTSIEARLGRGVFNVLDEGAVVGDTGTNATANATAFAAANAKALASGGVVYFPRGTYQTNATLTIYPNVSYVGDAGTRIKLANGANVDLVATQNFAVLYAGSTQAGPSRFVLRDLILDGNAANQTSGYVLSIYGSNFRVENVHVTGGKSGGIRSKWGTGGTNMESHWSSFKVYNNFGQQVDWQGPHDSVFANGHVFTDSTFHAGAAVAGSNGIKTSGNAAGEQFTNMHVWGYHEVGWRIQRAAKCYNCVGEGAGTNVYVDGNGNTSVWDGEVYGTNGTGPYAVATGGAGETGVRLGTSGSGSVWTVRVRGTSWNWAAGDKPVVFDSDNGCDVEITGRVSNAAAAWFGTRSFKTRFVWTDPDKPQFSEAPTFSGPGVPNASLGAVGSYYHRSDGTTGSRIYHKTAASTWTALSV